MKKRSDKEHLKILMYISFIITIVVITIYLLNGNINNKQKIISYPEEITIGQAIYGVNCEHNPFMSPPTTSFYSDDGTYKNFQNSCDSGTLLTYSCSDQDQLVFELEECPYGCEYGRCIEKKYGEHSFFFYGHRGCMVRGGECNYPENTIPALEYAIKSGATGIGIDITMSYDGKLMVGHDEKITDPKDKGCKKIKNIESELIPKLTKEQIQTNFICEINGNRAIIPTLEEVIDYLESKFPNKNIKYGIEGKHKGRFTEKEFGKKIAKVIINKGIIDRSVVASYHVDILVSAKETNPNIKLGIIGDHYHWVKNYIPFISKESSWKAIEKRINKLKSKGYEPEILIPEWTGGKDTWAKRVKWANSRGYKILPWLPKGTDNGDNYQLFKEIGMIGFTTDRPAYASKFKLTEFCTEKTFKSYHEKKEPHHLWGEFRNKKNQLCLDVKGYKAQTKNDIMLYKCETKTDQYWIHDTNGRIRNGKSNLCLGVSIWNNDVKITKCENWNNGQLWFKNEEGQIVNVKKNKCLTALGINDPVKIKSNKCLNREGTYYSSIYVDNCYKNMLSQQWDIISNQRIVSILSKRWG